MVDERLGVFPHRKEFAFNEQSSSLPPALSRRIVRSMRENHEKLRELVRSANDGALLELTPTADLVNRLGDITCGHLEEGRLSAVRWQMTGAAIRHALVCAVLVGLMYLVAWMDARVAGNLGFLGLSLVLVALLTWMLSAEIADLVRAVREALLAKRLLDGSLVPTNEQALMAIVRDVSIVGGKGIYVSRVKGLFLPEFIPWSQIGAVRLPVANGSIELLDTEGNHLASLTNPASATETCVEVYDRIDMMVSGRQASPPGRCADTQVR